MKIFAIYTLARVGIFLAVYGVIWLIVGRSLEWDAVSGLYTALIAMLVSSIIALTALRGLRASLAEQVAVRAEAAKAAFEARRRAEDAEAAEAAVHDQGAADGDTDSATRGQHQG